VRRGGGRWEGREEREGGERKGRGERRGSWERRERGERRGGRGEGGEEEGRRILIIRLSLIVHPSTRKAKPYNENTYIGQGTLMPPDSASECNRSRSYGIIIIRHFSYAWKYVKIDSTVSHNDTDTICREMGYTHYVRNSLITLSTAKQIFGQTYNDIDE
jgi:hypothetical protein